MELATGTYTLGPDRGRLWIRTRKTGAAAAAGHDLLIEVTQWDATLEVGVDPSNGRLRLTADSRSLKVLEGTGGMTKLGDDDKASIKETIDKEVLEGRPIEFRSTALALVDERLSVNGQLELADRVHAIAFDLIIGEDGRLTGAATVKQTDWGIKPYSGLFGTLKVIDEVTVEVAAELPEATRTR
jgi:polyisoprenoid-binding protein YceI